METVIVIKNKFGEFRSKKFEVSEEDYEKIIELSKNFYSSGYEMETESGFLVIPPDIIKESILFIETNETP
jgi:hypothetical protein